VQFHSKSKKRCLHFAASYFDRHSDIGKPPLIESDPKRANLRPIPKAVRVLEGGRPGPNAATDQEMRRVTTGERTESERCSSSVDRMWIKCRTGDDITISVRSATDPFFDHGDNQILHPWAFQGRKRLQRKFLCVGFLA